MANFVLIHGMFHGGWSWSKMTARLEADGHRVWAPDLAGCGASAVPPGEISLDRWVEELSGLVQTIEGPVILVGHSRGGIVISQLAEAVPDRVAALVYVAALLLPDGKSAMDLAAIVADSGVAMEPGLIRPQLNVTGDGLLLDPETASALYDESPAEERGWALERIGTEPLAPMLTPLSLSLDRYGSIPKVYIETVRDRAIPIALQRVMTALTPPDRLISLNADHMPIIHDVDEMTSALAAVAEQYG